MILTIGFLEFWLGIKYNDEKGEYQWISNGHYAPVEEETPSKHRNASDFLEVGNDNECVVIIFRRNKHNASHGGWYKTDCSNECSFICESSI